jgi:hypothetical protein
VIRIGRRGRVDSGPRGLGAKPGSAASQTSLIRAARPGEMIMAAVVHEKVHQGSAPKRCAEPARKPGSGLAVASVGAVTTLQSRAFRLLPQDPPGGSVFGPDSERRSGGPKAEVANHRGGASDILLTECRNTGHPPRDRGSCAGTTAVAETAPFGILWRFDGDPDAHVFEGSVIFIWTTDDACRRAGRRIRLDASATTGALR